MDKNKLESLRNWLVEEMSIENRWTREGPRKVDRDSALHRFQAFKMTYDKVIKLISDCEEVEQ